MRIPTRSPSRRPQSLESKTAINKSNSKQIYIYNNLHKKLKVLAAEEGVGLNDMSNQIMQYISDNPGFIKTVISRASKRKVI